MRLFLTKAERLVLWRRRRNLSQREAARRFRVSLYSYRAEENGECSVRAVELDTPIAAHERCFIRRRRAGMTLDEMAEETGLSRWWICQIERGAQSADALVDYWAGQSVDCARS